MRGIYVVLFVSLLSLFKKTIETVPTAVATAAKAAAGAAGIIQAGKSSLSPFLTDNKSVAVRVNIEIKNLTKWEFHDPVVDVNGGKIDLPPRNIFPLQMEVMVIFL